MALTPDEIVNKSFETTRFRDGYDQDEVDNFLDEIVTDYRALLEENERLKARVAELESQGESAPAAPQAPTQVAPVVHTDADDTDTAESAPIVEAATVPDAVAAQRPDGLLALAQRVHDEHVAQGEARKGELISEGEARAAEIEGEARARKQQLEADFDQQTKALEKRKAELEAKIDELKTFERDYRLKLRGYIESQLRDLDRSPSLAFGNSSSQDSK